jgi:proteasome accessory factor A
LEPCTKVLGADFELSNALEVGDSENGRVSRAAKRLLEQIDGYPKREYWGGTEIEWGRRFLSSSGASAYIDSDHLEINLPEHTRAADHPVIVFAGLRIAQKAQVAASAKLPQGGRINVTAAVSDGKQSWGHHLNVMIRRELFNALFMRKPHVAGFVATHLATATLYTGQGQVGAGNDRAACAYQLSQRADWFEEMFGHQTMHDRPLLNLRDEAHAGDGLARLHIIFFDRVLCPVANTLMAGATQLVLAMAEAGWTDPRLLLDDPLAAAHAVSRDLSLKQPLALAGRGRYANAVQVQQSLADLAGEFVASGAASDVVPGAEAIVASWRETVDLLRRRELAALMRRCDWALKYLLLERHRARKGLSWSAAEMKALDLRYSSLDPDEGLFWQMARAGQVDSMPAPERIEHFFREPPDDTRAYLRAHVLRCFGEHVADLNWGWIRFRLRTHPFWRSESLIAMPDPSRFGRAESDPLLARSQTLEELVDAVGAEAPPPWFGNGGGHGTCHHRTWDPDRSSGSGATWYPRSAGWY